MLKDLSILLQGLSAVATQLVTHSLMIKAIHGLRRIAPVKRSSDAVGLLELGHCPSVSHPALHNPHIAEGIGESIRWCTVCQPLTNIFRLLGSVESLHVTTELAVVQGGNRQSVSIGVGIFLQLFGSLGITLYDSRGRLVNSESHAHLSNRPKKKHFALLVKPGEVCLTKLLQGLLDAVDLAKDAVGLGKKGQFHCKVGRPLLSPQVRCLRSHLYSFLWPLVNPLLDS
mmetsp:Transcript_59652/g.159620  ORF Transcript_59652/g.159620 Transcript_59652/m.159620 type:complete len:228 (-) Transcript_59652:1138-1821(-)